MRQFLLRYPLSRADPITGPCRGEGCLQSRENEKFTATYKKIENSKKIAY
jgi:hypothetical protein